VATVLGVGAAQISLVNERSARNDRDTEVAFQAAEAALVDAETDVLGPNDSTHGSASAFSIAPDATAFVAGCGGDGEQQGLCAPAEPGADPAWMSVDFRPGAASRSPTAPSPARPTSAATPPPAATPARCRPAPRYIVEAVRSRGSWQANVLQSASAQDASYIFRVTAIGYGMREETQVVLQTTLYKPAASLGCPS
jgi:type IV pilus assembly protein PilX